MSDTDSLKTKEELMASFDANMTQEAVLEIIGTNVQTPGTGSKSNVTESSDVTAKGTESAFAHLCNKTNNKELKSILQLSREAKLNTNIVCKRKSGDVNKSEEKRHKIVMNVGKGNSYTLLFPLKRVTNI